MLAPASPWRGQLRNYMRLTFPSRMRCVVLLLLAAASAQADTLFFLASIEVWSVFANFLSFPLIMLMFVVEYGIRLRKLPHQKKHSIMDGVRAYWKTPAARPGVSPPAR